MKVVYVAGPYRAPEEDGIFENIYTARSVAKRLWGEGYAVICPHLNSCFMGGVVSNGEFVNRDLEILRRCDAICLLPGWEKSHGAIRELECAIAHNLEILNAGGGM